MKELLSLSIGGNPVAVPAGIPQPSADLPAKIIGNSLSIFLIAGIAVSVLMIVWGGIQWAYSRGDKQAVAAARAKITWAIVGLIIMMLAFGIVNIFSFLFGVNLLDLNLQ